MGSGDEGKWSEVEMKGSGEEGKHVVGRKPEHETLGFSVQSGCSRR